MEFVGKKKMNRITLWEGEKVVLKKLCGHTFLDIAINRCPFHPSSHFSYGRNLMKNKTRKIWETFPAPHSFLLSISSSVCRAPDLSGHIFHAFPGDKDVYLDSLSLSTEMKRLGPLKNKFQCLTVSHILHSLIFLSIFMARNDHLLICLISNSEPSFRLLLHSEAFDDYHDE